MRLMMETSQTTLSVFCVRKFVSLNKQHNETDLKTAQALPQLHTLFSKCQIWMSPVIGSLHPSYPTYETSFFDANSKSDLCDLHTKKIYLRASCFATQRQNKSNKCLYFVQAAQYCSLISCHYIQAITLRHTGVVAEVCKYSNEDYYLAFPISHCHASRVYHEVPLCVFRLLLKTPM